MEEGDRMQYAEQLLRVLGPAGLRGIDRRRGTAVQGRGSKNRRVKVAWDDGLISSAHSCTWSVPAMSECVYHGSTGGAVMYVTPGRARTLRIQLGIMNASLTGFSGPVGEIEEDVAPQGQEGAI